MIQPTNLQGPAVITPGVRVADAVASYWLAQVHVRLRREVCWFWHQRAGRPEPGNGALPPIANAAVENLDLTRFAEQKAAFFERDTAARYLTDTLTRLARPSPTRAAQSIWDQVSVELKLSEAAQFTLALALAHRLDAALGAIFATCLNDLSRPYPTLALAQRLWDDPNTIVALAERHHPLYTHGLLRRAEEAAHGLEWQEPLDLPGPLAEVFAGMKSPDQADALTPILKTERPLDGTAELVAWRLAQEPPNELELVPLLGPEASDFAALAGAIQQQGKRPLFAASSDSMADPAGLVLTSTLAWLAGGDLLLPEGLFDGGRRGEGWLLRMLPLPMRGFLPVNDRRALEHVPASCLRPAVLVPAVTFPERVGLLAEGLDGQREALRPWIEECARRFRLPARTLRRLGVSLRSRPRLDGETLVAACRAETRGGLEQLAQRVEPRFRAEELVLPIAQQQQFQEVLQAMRGLTRVHYHWGTAKAWNEGGLAVLFCGPPGTGKTMAAEVLANTLQLDMYRVDLSQVVNKYIGETEKNLKRIFDAAESSDCILFFDEADALFGKRTEVKDAHDRFANIEISYLLERMERFKGLAILATNRRKDLDEAFTRRLRYIIEFPMPGVEERERLWREGFPERVDTEALDFRYLARQFALTGGHIKSVIFNACLQAAAEQPSQILNGKAGRVEMNDVLVQLKRELQKMNRMAGNEQFGAHAETIAELVA